MAVRINFFMGLRVGELVALKWEDFYEGNQIHVVREAESYRMLTDALSRNKSKHFDLTKKLLHRTGSLMSQHLPQKLQLKMWYPSQTSVTEKQLSPKRPQMSPNFRTHKKNGNPDKK